MTHAGQIGILIDHDGVRLLGTLFLAPGVAPKPTALLLHGIPGIEKNYDLAHALREHGWNALIFHYRGCWGSSGTYDVRTIPEDVLAAVRLLVSMRSPLVDPEKIVAVGHSLGGWAAVLAAAREPLIRAVAAIAAVSDPAAFPLADPGTAANFTPWLTGVTPEDLAVQWSSLGPELAPVEQVEKVAPRPLLIIHSAVDEAVPVEHGLRLADRAGDNALYIEHPLANHAFTWHRGWLRMQLLGWLDTLFGSPGGDLLDDDASD